MAIVVPRREYDQYLDMVHNSGSLMYKQMWSRVSRTDYHGRLHWFEMHFVIDGRFRLISVDSGANRYYIRLEESDGI